MSGAPPDLLPAFVAFCLVTAALLAVPLSMLILFLYKRAVLRRMRATSQAVSADDTESAAYERASPSLLPARSRPLEVVMEDAEEMSAVGNCDAQLVRGALNGPWRNGTVYGLGGLAFAAVMTGAVMLADSAEPLPYTKIAVLLWTYLWPVVIVLVLTAACSRAQRAWMAAGYFAVIAVLTVIAPAHDAEAGTRDLLLFWGLKGGIPTLLAIAFLLRAVRSVGTLVATLMLASAVGALLCVGWVAAGEERMLAAASAGSVPGIGGRGMLLGLVLGDFLLAIIGGWLLARWLSRRYDRKLLGEQALVVDSVWLLFAVAHCVDLMLYGRGWALLPLFAFIAYKLVVHAGFTLLSAIAMPALPRHVLLLRVFGLGGRSENFFDDFRILWQHVGSVSMVAGPDLITRMIEPGELLEFLTGRLSRRFVAGRAGLEERLQALDYRQDPDGRYRYSGLFCHDTVWQMTVRTLAMMSDAVLMDLRGFDARNLGCTFEIGALLGNVSLSRVVFLTDASTDHALLEKVLQDQWSKRSARGPLVPVGSTARILRMSTGTAGSMRRLLELLLPEWAPRADRYADSQRSAGIAA
ncbi:MAG: hypothetical protein IT496_07050 [Gammaproteobacteria bacterium]|nr:hypothetical protein [Gammaproteobacteria bacterium]MCG3146486.1 hypothetical protein [Gammaproteobacteria bacterium]